MNLLFYGFKYIISANPLTVTTYELRYDSAAFIVQKEFQLNAIT